MGPDISSVLVHSGLCGSGFEANVLAFPVTVIPDTFPVIVPVYVPLGLRFFSVSLQLTEFALTWQSEIRSPYWISKCSGNTAAPPFGVDVDIDIGAVGCDSVGVCCTAWWLPFAQPAMWAAVAPATTAQTSLGINAITSGPPSSSEFPRGVPECYPTQRRIEVET